jgi:hypothetical protein
MLNKTVLCTPTPKFTGYRVYVQYMKLHMYVYQHLLKLKLNK